MTETSAEASGTGAVEVKVVFDTSSSVLARAWITCRNCGTCMVTDRNTADHHRNALTADHHRNTLTADHHRNTHCRPSQKHSLQTITETLSLQTITETLTADVVHELSSCVSTECQRKSYLSDTWAAGRAPCTCTRRKEQWRSTHTRRAHMYPSCKLWVL